MLFLCGMICMDNFVIKAGNIYAPDPVKPLLISAAYNRYDDLAFYNLADNLLKTWYVYIDTSRCSGRGSVCKKSFYFLFNNF